MSGYGRLEKYLDIAQMLSQGMYIPEITKKLKVSGKDVGKVRRLLENGYITFDPNGNAKFSAPRQEIEAFLEEYDATRKRIRREAFEKPKGRPPKDVSEAASDAVEAILKEETAAEAQTRTRQYFQIGKTVAQAYWKWAQKRGIPLEEAVRHDIGKIVSEALEYHARAKELEKRVMELEDALRAYAKEVDPIVRLRKAARIITDFIQFAALAEIAGFNIEESPLVDHYQKLIEYYLKGGYE